MDPHLFPVILQRSLRRQVSSIVDDLQLTKNVATWQDIHSCSKCCFVSLSSTGHDNFITGEAVRVHTVTAAMG